MTSRKRFFLVLMFLLAAATCIYAVSGIPENALAQVRRTSPPRPNSFDELVQTYNGLKAQKASNSNLATMIRYATSFKEQRVIDWLKSLYATETDRYLKQTVISTMGNMNINKLQIIQWLSGIYHNEKDSSLQQSAVSALGSLGSKEAAAALMDIYRKVSKGGDSNMKTYVTRALSRVAEHLDLAILADLLKGAQSSYDRADVARAIAKIGTREAIAILISSVNLDKNDPNAGRYGERYRITYILQEIARDNKDDTIIAWIADDLLQDRKTPEEARVAFVKGFTERSRKHAAYERAQKEREEKRRQEEEERKKAEEEAKKNPGASPPPPPPPPTPAPGQSSRTAEPPKPLAAQKLVGLLDDRSAMVRGAVAEFLAACGDVSVVSSLVSHLSEKDQDALIRIIAALGELKASDAVQPLLGKLSKGKWEIKAAIIDALGRIGDPSVVETLKKYLNDRRWQVRAAAIVALGRIRCKESVEALIERMRKEQGRLLGDIARALDKLTGMGLGADVKEWTHWWKAAKDNYVLPKELDGSPDTANPGVAMGPKTELAKVPKYHGIDVISHRICFIIDISGSMSGRMNRAGRGGNTGQGKPGAQPGTPPTADPSKKKDDQKKDKKEPIFKGKKGQVQPKDDTKIEFAKAELINCIVALNPKVKFNIISFESSVHAWQKQLVPASSGNKKEAISWTTAMRPTGATNLGDAILLAFEDKEVDTIFVLSDGQPNQGKLPSADAILNEVRRLNTARRIVIHTINFAGARDFMKKLAEENGGQFVDY